MTVYVDQLGDEMLFKGYPLEYDVKMGQVSWKNIAIDVTKKDIDMFIKCRKNHSFNKACDLFVTLLRKELTSLI